MTLRIALCIGLLAGLASPALAAWEETARSPQQTEILNRVEQLVASTQKPVVVFDLDSTLYDNRNRSAVILQEFGKTKGIASLTKVTADRIADGFKIPELVTAVAKPSPEAKEPLLAEFKAFWSERFFTNGYVKYDRPLPGAVDFIRALHAKGATVIYITGRDEQNMRAGTEARMRADGFPLGGERAQLFLKPKSNIVMGKDVKTDTEYKDALKKSDSAFKQASIAKAKSLGTVVASFENEPAHINLYQTAFHTEGKGMAVFLDTDHFPNAPALNAGVQTVKGFLR